MFVVGRDHSPPECALLSFPFLLKISQQLRHSERKDSVICLKVELLQNKENHLQSVRRDVSSEVTGAQPTIIQQELGSLDQSRKVL